MPYMGSLNLFRIYQCIPLISALGSSYTYDRIVIESEFCIVHKCIISLHSFIIFIIFFLFFLSLFLSGKDLLRKSRFSVP